MGQSDDELKNFETSKGTIKFPRGKKVPVRLIISIVKYRAIENQEGVEVWTKYYIYRQQE
ncbi:MAG: hypothetical protein NTW16_06850 [Bacteroidetes bacterium]|nr:hypothetical protein [Bacteroidota bacterium]